MIGYSQLADSSRYFLLLRSVYFDARFSNGI